MRLLFAGTPEFAVPGLRRLSAYSDECAGRHQIVGVLSAPDRPAGRGKQVKSPPVARVAKELDLPLLQPERLGRQARERIIRLEPDLLVCAAYGRIFGPKFLELFPYGGINIHPSLLPRHRGPAPVPAAILAGDERTGVCIQRISLEMDAGDVIAYGERSLDGTERSGELEMELAELGASLLPQVVADIDDGTVRPQPQREEEATYCRLISKEDAWIDWDASAVWIDRMVRAYDPWPGAWTTLGDRRLRILEARPVATEGQRMRSPCGGVQADGGRRSGRIVGVDNENGILVETGDGCISLRRLQLETKKPLGWRDFWNGLGPLDGVVLGGHSGTG